MKYIKLDNKLIAFVDGETVEVDHLHIHYRKIQKAFNENNPEKIKDLLDIEDIIKNGIYLLYRSISDDKNPLYIHYVNTNKDQQMFRHISHVSDILTLATTNTRMLDSIPTPLMQDLTHIGTYSSVDEILDEYPEFFI